MIVHRFKRHCIDEKNSFLPADNMPQWEKHHGKKFDPSFYSEVRNDLTVVGYEQTRLQDMQEAAADGQRWCGRMDILLWRGPDEPCPTCGQDRTRQYAVYPAPEGQLLGDVDKAQPEDLVWAYEESRLCWEVAKKEPLFKKVLESRICW